MMDYNQCTCPFFCDNLLETILEICFYNCKRNYWYTYVEHMYDACPSFVLAGDSNFFSRPRRAEVVH